MRNTVYIKDFEYEKYTLLVSIQNMHHIQQDALANNLSVSEQLNKTLQEYYKEKAQ